MPDPRQEAVVAHLRRSQQAVERVAADGKFLAATLAIAERIAASLKGGGKVLLAGNGGSAADAQHIAAELVGRFINDRAPLAAIALTTDTSALTAIGNDYGFEQVFERQVRALGRKGDVFIGISTSGRSPNIVAALQAARDLGLVTIGFTRDAQTPMHALCDLTLAVPSEETALIQQIHITAAHAICHLVERELFGVPERG
ncbi:MAG: D-sedoheptulose 7-phosphate isomerase [Alphaproteobacteria bacterium]|jgi:D-sedoheptulose 7-phosphate isomerase|nr:D-sedoheptulose 7-phosphate isomerase [Alphaproteobacteria bacterium]